MPNRTAQKIDFGRIGRRVIEANFDGGDLSSDGGLMLLRRTDERIGLTRAVAAVFSDPRDPARITHRLRDLLAQRIYGLCCGYEDLNDHDTLRSDLLLQTAVGRLDALASSPTLCRLETRATRAQAVALHGVLIEQFIAAHRSAPAELVLDIDASDVPLHGRQELAEFHAYYDHHCYLPLYVFCGQASAGVRVAAQPHRWGEERGGGHQATGGATAPDLARRAPDRARRLGLLPPAAAAVLRARRRELPHRSGAQCAAGGPGGGCRADACR